MIQEAKSFDNRLKKMGFSINVEQLINDKENKVKKTKYQDEESEDDMMA